LISPEESNTFWRLTKDGFDASMIVKATGFEQAGVFVVAKTEVKG